MGRSVDKLPTHIGGSGHAVYFNHVIFPLDAVRLFGMCLRAMAMVMFVILTLRVPFLSWQQFHSAFRAAARFMTRHVTMHRADVSDCRAPCRLRTDHVHLGDEAQCLIGCGHE